MMQPTQRLQRWLALKALAIFAGLGLVFALEYEFGISDAFSIDQIQLWLGDAGMAAPLLFIALMAAAVVFSPLPSVPLDVVAGSFFGPVLGTLYASLGALLGAQMAFLLGRFLGRALIERVVSGHINFCAACSDHLLGRLVFVSRLIPFISFDVVSYGAGLTKMSLLRFSVATYLGMLPLTVLYVSFGALVLENQHFAWVLGLLFVALFFLLPRWIERNNLFSMRERMAHLAELTQEPVQAAGAISPVTRRDVIDS